MKYSIKRLDKYSKGYECSWAILENEDPVATFKTRREARDALKKLKEQENMEKVSETFFLCYTYHYLKDGKAVRTAIECPSLEGTKEKLESLRNSEYLVGCKIDSPIIKKVVTYEKNL